MMAKVVEAGRGAYRLAARTVRDVIDKAETLASHYLPVQNLFQRASGLEQRWRSSWPTVEVEDDCFDGFDGMVWLVVEEETCVGSVLALARHFWMLAHALRLSASEAADANAASPGSLRGDCEF